MLSEQGGANVGRAVFCIISPCVVRRDTWIGRMVNSLCLVLAVAVQSEQLPIYFCVSSLFSSCLLFTTCELAADHKGLQAAAAMTLFANLANSCWLVPHQVNTGGYNLIFIIGHGKKDVPRKVGGYQRACCRV